MRHRTRKLWLFLATVVSLGVSLPAAATLVDLGRISAATTLSFRMDGLRGAFEDFYTFSIDPGLVFDVSSFASTGFVRRYFIPDFHGDLSDDTGVVATGISTTRRLPEGFPAYDVSFDPIRLGMGDYSLRLAGTGVSAFPDVQIPATYTGTITFAAVTASVPEPGSLGLALLALAGLGFGKRRS